MNSVITDKWEVREKTWGTEYISNDRNTSLRDVIELFEMIDDEYEVNNVTWMNSGYGGGRLKVYVEPPNVNIGKL